MRWGFQGEAPPPREREIIMGKRGKLVLAALTAALALGVLVGTTSANRIATSSNTFRMAFASMKLIGFATVTCRVTIEGSYHSRTLSKVAEMLVGYTTKATVQECTGGTASIVGLPWHIRYAGFNGTLPAITSGNHKIVNGSFQATAIGITCQFTGTTSSPMKGIVSRNTSTGVATALRVDETAPIPVSSGGFGCGTSGRLEGTSGGITVGGGTASITVTLVA
jgi:hypothetical protein